MRIHKAIENIQAAIDRHQDEWLKDNGYEPEEHVRKRTAEPEPPKKPKPSRQTGQLSANRFLGETTEPEQEPETQAEPAEIIPVIKQNDKNHSWLYNEVLAAINDAAENNKGTKIIAVFIPIVRSGEEFKDLPVDEKVTLPTVYDENVHVEELPPFKEFLEEPAQPQDAEPLQKEEEPEPQPEEHMPVSLEKTYTVGIEQEALPEEEQAMTEPEPDIVLSEPEPEPELEPIPIEETAEIVQEEPEPETVPVPVEETAEIVQEEPEPEIEPESVGDILSGEPENPEELQDIFRTMEEKLEETSQPEEEPEEPEAFADELVDAIMEETLDSGQEEQNIDFEDLESEPEPDGQTLEFTEIEEIEPTEEPAAEPEHIMLKDMAITAEDSTENPSEETEDDEFDDTEILPDAEEINI